MSKKSEIKALLDDTSFDRQIAPKDPASNLLVNLLRKRAIDEKSAVLLSECAIKEDQLDPLLQTGRVQMFANSPTKVYLSKMGQIVACGELSIRNRERKHK